MVNAVWIVLTLRPRMEQKLATVLFVDLVDSTSFVSASDPDVVRRRVTQFFDRVSSSIER